MSAPDGTSGADLEAKTALRRRLWSTGMIVGRRVLLALLVSLICAGPIAAQDSALPDAAPAPGRPIAAVTARHGMVVAQEARAARVGLEILRQGGNAVDAAVATGFALAVTYPRAGNIGGGGYMLVHLAEVATSTPRSTTVRPRRPATTPGIFLMSAARPIRASRATPRSAIGVPGTVAGLALAHAKYGSGKFTLAQLIAPAIALARDGIPVEDDIADSLPRSQARLARWPSPRRSSSADGARSRPARLWCSATSPIRSPRSRARAAAFYEGAIADKIVAACAPPAA
jgi:gamma-glutamyltranspeptidase/glutathione hydrolase